MQGTNVEDLQLVTRTLEGDAAAFTALVRRHEVSVYNLAYRLVSNADDAADVAQEAFLAAYEGLPRFRAESSFYTWLYRIVVNKALTMRRQKYSRREVATGAEDCSPLAAAADAAAGPREIAERAERADFVQDAIGGLPEDFRSVVVLKDIEGLEYEQIAEVMDIPLGTVKSRLHRARLLLREALAPYLGGVA